MEEFTEILQDSGLFSRVLFKPAHATIWVQSHRTGLMYEIHLFKDRFTLYHQGALLEQFDTKEEVINHFSTIIAQ